MKVRAVCANTNAFGAVVFFFLQVFLFVLFVFKVGSVPNVGLELTTWKIKETGLSQLGPLEL